MIAHRAKTKLFESSTSCWKHAKNLVYLSGNISESERGGGVEVQRRIQTGANTWRNVDGVMVDRKISRKLKGKVLDNCVVPASTYGLETLALSKWQQHKLQVCENNLIRRIAGDSKGHWMLGNKNLLSSVKQRRHIGTVRCIY